MLFNVVAAVADIEFFGLENPLADPLKRMFVSRIKHGIEGVESQFGIPEFDKALNTAEEATGLDLSKNDDQVISPQEASDPALNYTPG